VKNVCVCVCCVCLFLERLFVDGRYSVFLLGKLLYVFFLRVSRDEIRKHFIRMFRYRCVCMDWNQYRNILLPENMFWSSGIMILFELSRFVCAFARTKSVKGRATWLHDLFFSGHQYA
jgi:hypothetical protein